MVERGQLMRQQILVKMPPEEALFPRLEGVVFTSTGVHFQVELPMDVWGLLAVWAQGTWATMQRAMPWVIGDILKYGDVHFGEDYLQYIEVTNRAEATLRKYLWLAERVPYELRDDAIPLGVYEMIARYGPARQAELLAWYRENGSDRDLLRALLRDEIVPQQIAQREPQGESAAALEEESAEVPFSDPASIVLKREVVERVAFAYRRCEEALAQQDYVEMAHNLEVIGRALGLV